MTSQQLLLEGVELMFFGMGLVFLFLILLIYCIKGMSFVLERLAPEESQCCNGSANASTKSQALKLLILRPCKPFKLPLNSTAPVAAECTHTEFS